MAQPDTEREELEDLVHLPGWFRFCAHVKDQLTGPLLDLLAHGSSDRDDGLALRKIQQLSTHRQLTLQHLEWPKERLKQLARAEEHRTRRPRAAELRQLPNRGRGRV